MILARHGPRLLALLAALALAGCAGRGVHEPADAGAMLQARANLMQAWRVWSFEGRVAVRDGNEGGSGNIRWREGDGRYEVTLRAPVTASTWILSGDPAQSELRGVGPEPIRGPDAGELLARETGWNLPVEHARAWVRGLALEPSNARLESVRGDLPATLVEDGWTVEFREWAPAHDDQPPLPRRIVARKAPWEVRLAIARWSLQRGD